MSGADGPTRVTHARYTRAESFLAHNVEQRAFCLSVQPQWLDGSDRFRYRVATRQGPRCMLVDPVAGTNTPCPEEETPCRVTYQGSTGSGGQVASPDGAWNGFVREHNLFVESTATGEQVQLTWDGESDYDYATPLPSPLVSAGLTQPAAPVIYWSPDSRMVLTYRIDSRSAGRLHLIQSTPADAGLRPQLHSYVYPLPGDEDVPLNEPWLFHVRTGKAIKVAMPPLPQMHYGRPRHHLWWDGGRLYMLCRQRGFRTISLYEINPENGQCRTVVEETQATGWDPRISFWPDTASVRTAGGGREVIWYSARDGWGHLYLYDGTTGLLKGRVTNGPWVMHDLVHVDEQRRLVYFTAAGREPGRNPYYRHFYRAALDGGEPELLTPADADHEISMAPSGSYFVDTCSRVDLPPVSLLRMADGSLVMTLEVADIERLLITGWRIPERFQVKARDGVTDIYGVILRPSDYDPTKKYPVLEGIYTGPQWLRAPRAFGGGERWEEFWQDQALAELGFVVVLMDGLGMSYRDKAFEDFSYQNLGDAGLADHVAALRQLAEKDPSLDLNRVGVYGASAGGYAAVRAILAQPDVYKVAVAWAGNHDHLLDKAGWVERYMGPERGDHYRVSANASLAANLKGKLLLMHGEMDENVHPAATMRLVAALIEANKDFDLLILPNLVHFSQFHPYVNRRRWDYFVRHLLGAEPPDGGMPVTSEDGS